MSLLLIGVLTLCPEIKFENKTNDPWNETDYKHAEIAHKRCGIIYKNSACVKIFTKRTENRDYSVICGAGLERDNKFK
jgi:hypothetical protein